MFQLSCSVIIVNQSKNAIVASVGLYPNLRLAILVISLKKLPSKIKDFASYVAKKNQKCLDAENAAFIFVKNANKKMKKTSRVSRTVK